MSRALEKLAEVVSRLRSPRGCPWDRKQTHRSLIPYLREEAQELAVALRRGRWHEMEDELGDILFHVFLHAKIAEENGQFSLDDVARSQALKLYCVSAAKVPAVPEAALNCWVISVKLEPSPKMRSEWLPS